jgi:hypothetical protein
MTTRGRFFEPDGTDGTRIQLEREADEVRARLAATLSALDRRRHEMLSLGTQVRKHQRQISLASGLASSFLLAVAASTVVRVRRRQQRRRQERIDAAMRFWRHPEWLARRRSFAARAMAGVAAGAAPTMGGVGILVIVVARGAARGRRTRIQIREPTAAVWGRSRAVVERRPESG